MTGGAPEARRSCAGCSEVGRSTTAVENEKRQLVSARTEGRDEHATDRLELGSKELHLLAFRLAHDVRVLHQNSPPAPSFDEQDIEEDLFDGVVVGHAESRVEDDREGEKGEDRDLGHEALSDLLSLGRYVCEMQCQVGATGPGAGT